MGLWEAKLKIWHTIFFYIRSIFGAVSEKEKFHENPVQGRFLWWYHVLFNLLFFLRRLKSSVKNFKLLSFGFVCALEKGDGSVTVYVLGVASFPSVYTRGLYNKSPYSKPVRYRTYMMPRYLLLAYVKYGVRSPKFFLGSICTAVLIGWDPATPPSPRIWAHIRGRYWSAKVDEIFFWAPGYCS